VASLRTHLKQARRWRRRVLAGGDAEDVHRLRNVLRRLAIAIQLATDVCPLPPPLTDLAAADAARSLGKLRDAGVARLGLRSLRLMAKGGDRDVAARLLRRAARRERRLLERARRQLRGKEFRGLLTALHQALRQPAVLPAGAQPLRSATAGFIGRGRAAIAGHQAWSLPASLPPRPDPASEVARHDLRVKIRELRDSLRLLAERPGEYRDQLDPLDLLAGALGDLRDLTKLRPLVAESAALGALVDGQLIAAADRWKAARDRWLGSASADQS
jgi:CHAD domain-containing protein